MPSWPSIQSGEQDRPLAARIVAAVANPQVVVGLRHAVVVDPLLHKPQQQRLPFVLRIFQQHEQSDIRDDVGDLPAVVRHVLQRVHHAVDPLALMVQPDPLQVPLVGLHVGSRFRGPQTRQPIALQVARR